MDPLAKEHRSWLMSRVRAKDTKPELLVRRLLHGMGYRYRLHVRGLPGTPDVVFHRRQLAIFVHGCFWHGHDCRAGRLPTSNASFWGAKLDANRERDKANVAQLKALGWTVVVVWQCEMKNLDALTQRLITALNDSDCDII